MQIFQSSTYCLPAFVLAVLYFYPWDYVNIPLNFCHFLRWIFEGGCPWKPLAPLLHRIWLPEHDQTWCRIWIVYGWSKNFLCLVLCLANLKICSSSLAMLLSLHSQGI